MRGSLPAFRVLLRDVPKLAHHVEELRPEPTPSLALLTKTSCSKQPEMSAIGHVLALPGLHRTGLAHTQHFIQPWLPTQRLAAKSALTSPGTTTQARAALPFAMRRLLRMHATRSQPAPAVSHSTEMRSAGSSLLPARLLRENWLGRVNWKRQEPCPRALRNSDTNGQNHAENTRPTPALGSLWRSSLGHLRLAVFHVRAQATRPPDPALVLRRTASPLSTLWIPRFACTWEQNSTRIA